MPVQNAQATTSQAPSSEHAELPVPQQPDPAHAERSADLVTREQGSVAVRDVQFSYRVDGARAKATHAILPVRQLKTGTLISVNHKVVIDGSECVKTQAYVTRQALSIRTFKTDSGETVRIEGYSVYAIRGINADADGNLKVTYVGREIVDNMRPSVDSHELAYVGWVPLSDISTYNSVITIAFPKKQESKSAAVARALFA